MAKIKTGIRAREGKYGRRIKAVVALRRTADRAPNSFEACVGVGTKTGRGDYRCAYGRNPRAAIANAMGAMAKHLRKRKGAFRGHR